MARLVKKTEKPLWKLSLTVHPEAEDAAGAALEDIFTQPPSIYSDLEKGISVLTVWQEGSAEPLRTRAPEIEAALGRITKAGLKIGDGNIQVEKVRREDWAESWKKHFKALRIGSTLLIRPSWIKLKPVKGQAVVVLDPGLSFGTGQHATTSFCLRQLVANRPKKIQTEPRSFLDIGTGSGILAIAAAKLGYTPVDAFDFDPVAVEVARRNATANKVDSKVAFKRADLTKLPFNSRKKHDLVCANLIYDLLLEERDKILNRLAPGGVLVLAGILATQFAAVREAYAARGMKLKQEKVEKEWQSGAFQATNNQ
jgi:ribosomal protein L11 methyltransferase